MKMYEEGIRMVTVAPCKKRAEISISR